MSALSRDQEPLPGPARLLTIFCSLRYRNTVSVIDLATLPRVPGSVIDVDRMTTHEAGAKFAELICADPQWLDQEFSALMAATFSAPPALPRPPAPPTVPPDGYSHRPPSGQPARPGHIRLPPVRVAPRCRRPGQQRSPPPSRPHG